MSQRRALYRAGPGAGSGPRSGPRPGEGSGGALYALDRPPYQAYAGHTVMDRSARILLGIAVFLAAYHQWLVGPVNITVSDVALILAFCLMAVQGRISTSPFGYLTPFWFAALGLFLGGLFLGSLFNGDLFRWIIIAVQYLVAFLMLPMAIMSQSRIFVRRLGVLFVLGVAAMEACGILVSFTMTSDQATALFGIGFFAGNGRVGTFVGEANWNGAMIASAVPILLYAIHRRQIAVPAGIALAGILLWGLLLSASVTGFAATTFAVLVTLAVAGRAYLAKIIIPLALAAFLFVMSGAPVPGVFQQRVGTALASGDVTEAGTFQGRVGLITEAWDMAERTSFIGVGADQFRTYSSEHQPVHNMYLLVWTEGGVVALLGLLAILVMLIVLTTTRGGGMPEVAMCMSVLVVLLIYTMASPHMFSRLWTVPIMLALGHIHGRNMVYPMERAPGSF